jgi:hypothetical protein
MTKALHLLWNERKVDMDYRRLLLFRRVVVSAAGKSQRNDCLSVLVGVFFPDRKMAAAGVFVKQRMRAIFCFGFYAGDVIAFQWARHRPPRTRSKLSLRWDRGASFGAVAAYQDEHGFDSVPHLHVILCKSRCTSKTGRVGSMPPPL